MKSHPVSPCPTALCAPLHRMAPAHAMRLGRRGGELTVVEGRVWLTRSGDLGDHVVTAGQRVWLGAAEDAVVESWDAGAGAVLRWQPAGPGFVGAVLAEPLHGVAFLAGRLAAGFAALARRAAGGAARAQGRITSGGESVAS